jgi:hypothetical protein
VPATVSGHESAIVAVVELSARFWLAGVPRRYRWKLDPSAEALLGHLDHSRRRAGEAASCRKILPARFSSEPPARISPSLISVAKMLAGAAPGGPARRRAGRLTKNR